MRSEPRFGTRVKRATDHWIFEEYATPVESLAFYRILYALTFFAYVIPRWDWIPSFPDSFFNPPVGPTLFFTGFPGAWYFHGLTALLVLAGVCLLFGHRTRLASLVLAFGLVAGFCWEFSFGKISHSIALVLVPLVMSFSGWGHAYSLDERAGRIDGRARDAWPLAMLALLIGGAFLTAALPKVLGGWLALDTQATQGQLLFNFFVMERQPWAAELAAGLHAPWFWEMLDIGTIVLEAGFVVAALRRTFFRGWLLLAMAFHLSVLFTLDIVFLSLPLAYGAFVDWRSVTQSRAFQRARVWLAPLARFDGRHLSVLAACVFAVFTIWGNPVQHLSMLLLDDPEKLWGGIGYGIALAVGGVWGARLLRGQHAAGATSTP